MRKARTKQAGITVIPELVRTVVNFSTENTDKLRGIILWTYTNLKVIERVTKTVEELA